MYVRTDGQAWIHTISPVRSSKKQVFFTIVFVFLAFLVKYSFSSSFNENFILNMLNFAPEWFIINFTKWKISRANVWSKFLRHSVEAQEKTV